jgi:hypothetical protein
VELRDAPVTVLLAEAASAGLVVEAVGDRLKVRGPSAFQHLGRLLLARKAEVLAALRAATNPAESAPAPRPDAAGWDAARAAAVLTATDARLDALLAEGGWTDAQQNVLGFFRAVAHGHAARHSSLLFADCEPPAFFEQNVASWRAMRRGARPCAAAPPAAPTDNHLWPSRPGPAPRGAGD